MTRSSETPADAVLVQSLRREREGLNARFAARRLAGTVIDGPSLLEHLRDRVAPILRSVHAAAPGRTDAVLVTLYEVSLDLLASALIGPSAKHPHVTDAWLRVLPPAARWVAEDPLRVAGCVSNAICRVAGHRGARPEEWIVRMASLARECESLRQWLDCGRVAAWLAGLVQFRRIALETVARLPRKTAAAVLGLPAETTAESLSEGLRRLSGNPWCSVESAFAESRSEGPPACVRSAGAFRGFGGEFLRPPTVRAVGDRLYATDGHGTWRLMADVYGTWLCRTADPPPGAGSARPATVTLADDGTVRWDGTSVRFTALAGASACAWDGFTLAVTTPTSHHVVLIGRPGVAR